MTPYNPASTPGSSQDFRERMGDPNCSLKTSTELLKVLNRIWCLEEQHASNVSLLKALKSELDNAQTRIKDLLREKHKDRQVIDDLMKQIADHKLVKRNTDQDRVQSALQSVRQELEDERKLRKRSESLHRKMARDISEMKSSFSKALNELEKERRARVLLEDLCDEFAMGIRDYEQELRSQKMHRGHVDSLVLHISEAWLDERVQMKLAEEMRKDMGDNCMIADKLRPEIETFLKARKTLDPREDLVGHPKRTSKGSGFRRQSLESFPLNEATGAPKHVDVDDVDDGDEVEQGILERRSKRFWNRGGNSNHIIDNLLRNNSSSLEGERIHPESELPDVHSLMTGPTSPVKNWESKITSSQDHEISESSSNWVRGFKEGTLKARLLEARLEGRNSQSKGLKGAP